MSNMEINLKYFKALAFLALTLTTYTAQENDTSVLKKSLKPWQPIEVSKSGDTLTHRFLNQLTAARLTIRCAHLVYGLWPVLLY